jgi:hypothetical protein
VTDEIMWTEGRELAQEQPEYARRYTRLAKICGVSAPYTPYLSQWTERRVEVQACRRQGWGRTAALLIH